MPAATRWVPIWPLILDYGTLEPFDFDWVLLVQGLFCPVCAQGTDGYCYQFLGQHTPRLRTLLPALPAHHLFSQKPQLKAFVFFHRIFFNWVQKLAYLTFYSVYPSLDGVDGFSLVLWGIFMFRIQIRGWFWVPVCCWLLSLEAAWSNFGPLYMDHQSCVFVVEETVVQEPVTDAPLVHGDR